MENNRLKNICKKIVESVPYSEAMKNKAIIIAAVLLGTTNAQAATITAASATVSLADQSVYFQIVWDSVPDFFTVDSVGRPKDQFQYSIMNDARGPTNFQSWANLTASADVKLTESVGSVFDFSRAAPLVAPLAETGTTVGFTAPFSALNESDGLFTYLLVGFNFGGSDRLGFAGLVFPFISEPQYATKTDIFAPTPIPGSLLLLASGLALLAGLRRGLRPAQTSAATAPIQRPS